MNVLITLCARGGSKGIPGKNIKPLNGIPLIAYSILVAKQFAEKYSADIAISTDDDTIKATASSFGIETDYLRPAELASDTAGKIDTIRALKDHQEKILGKKYDYILDLDITSPLRTLEDLCTAFETLQCDTEALNLFSVSSATKNPYFNMVEIMENGYYGLVKSGNQVLSRQTAPRVFELNASFYFYKKKFFDENYKTVFTQHSLIYHMPHICFDIDHVIDFEFIDFLLANKKLDFAIWTS